MAKSKKTFFCTECGVETGKWLGRCTSCGEWNTIKEITISSSSKTHSKVDYKSGSGAIAGVTTPIKIANVKSSDIERMDVGYVEANRVLGGGLVPGSLVLLGGEPGIGKSTLSLQLALKMGDRNVLYVSGEESPEQIKMRAERLGATDEECYILADTSLDNILSVASDTHPDIIIIDSIQTVYSEGVESAAGGLMQIRECTAHLMRFAKQSGTSIFIIGHITKDGAIAGPKILEHMVDVVLQFEGDANNVYRLLRGVKNRFGATNEIGVFEMLHEGLREVTNPSDILLSHYEEALSGVAVGATMEGARPFLIEVQSLVNTSTFGNPQRTTTGFDTKRLSMLLAVIEKRVNLKMSSKDVFLNIAGGFKVNDPGLDATVVASLISSFLDRDIDKDICFAAEIGLSGEIRPASHTEQRVMEAARHGFKRVIVSSYAAAAMTKKSYKIKVEYVSNIEEFCKKLFS